MSIGQLAGLMTQMAQDDHYGKQAANSNIGAQQQVATY